MRQDGSDQNKNLRMRWVMISMAFLATVLNYLHRLSFNYLSAEGPLRRLIPDDAFGYIAACFFIAYLVSNSVSGFVVDKLGTRLGYSIFMAFWTTAGLLHAVARTPLQFGAFRALLGIGEAGNWPAAIKLSGEWFTPEERSTASGIFNSGSAIGAIAAPPLVAWLGTSYGIASVGAGLGGAVFQALSGIAVRDISIRFNYSTAYSVIFIGYGTIALIGLAIILFRTGNLVRSQELYESLSTDS